MRNQLPLNPSEVEFGVIPDKLYNFERIDRSEQFALLGDIDVIKRENGIQPNETDPEKWAPVDQLASWIVAGNIGLAVRKAERLATIYPTLEFEDAKGVALWSFYRTIRSFDVSRFIETYQQRSVSEGIMPSIEDSAAVTLLAYYKKAFQFDAQKLQLVAHSRNIKIPQYAVDNVAMHLQFGESLNNTGSAASRALIHLASDSSGRTVGDPTIELESVYKPHPTDRLLSEADEIDDFEFTADAVSFVAQSLESLHDREREILRMRFGLDGETPKTLEEVGDAFGVTRERIRQIEAKALSSIRGYVASKKLHEPGSTRVAENQWKKEDEQIAKMKIESSVYNGLWKKLRKNIDVALQNEELGNAVATMEFLERLPLQKQLRLYESLTNDPDTIDSANPLLSQLEGIYRISGSTSNDVRRISYLKWRQLIKYAEVYRTYVVTDPSKRLLHDLEGEEKDQKLKSTFVSKVKAIQTNLKTAHDPDYFNRTNVGWLKPIVDNAEKRGWRDTLMRVMDSVYAEEVEEFIKELYEDEEKSA